MADVPARRGPPPLQGDYGYEGYPNQADAYDPYRRMPPGPMPRGPRPQVSCHKTLNACCSFL